MLHCKEVNLRLGVRSTDCVLQRRRFGALLLDVSSLNLAALSRAPPFFHQIDPQASEAVSGRSGGRVPLATRHTRGQRATTLPVREVQR